MVVSSLSFCLGMAKHVNFEVPVNEAFFVAFIFFFIALVPKHGWTNYTMYTKVNSEN